MNLKLLAEERAGLLNDYKEAVDATPFDKEKCDRLYEAIQKKDAEIKFTQAEDEDFVKSFNTVPVHEIRDAKTGKPIKQGSHEELGNYFSDVVKSAFGYSVQNRDILESSGSGQYIVPEHLKGPMISYIIEKSLLGRLGVPNVAVQTDTTKYAEVTALPTANTIAEGAELTETDPTFTARTLQMHSYRAGTIVTQEFIEDSIEHPKNIMEPLSQSIADNIDSDFINGGGWIHGANGIG
ncbi:MAG: hypothetical protein AMS26_13710 [Bacteroides sp. SM23_62]|nr:MAG: hypothetical protein AMS26_13710 [Bacteroides sp. SM23_62]